MAQHRNKPTLSFTATDEVVAIIVSKTLDARRRTGRSNQSAVICELILEWARLTEYEPPTLPESPAKPAPKKSRKKS